MAFAEYVWLDGSTPTQGLRSKTRVVSLDGEEFSPEQFPESGFDGSSTGQAERSDSDCTLKPVCVVRDPTRTGNSYLVLCEVFNADATKHVSNTRGVLREILACSPQQRDAWIGFEQQYTLMRDGRPLGFPNGGYPAAQGPYYCGVGADRAFGREIAEAHARLCEEAGLMIYGLNAQVLPGQWEFQIGYRDRAGDDPSLLNASDHLWLARYLLHRVAEQAGVVVSFECKPVKGEWNGSRLHANFSSAAMRGAEGIDAIYEAIKKLALQHDTHIAVYGEGLEERLTGTHATWPIFEFKAGAADRTASVRIPLGVEQQGAGYFEDRRPGANADPYTVAARLAATVFGIEFPGTPASAR